MLKNRKIKTTPEPKKKKKKEREIRDLSWHGVSRSGHDIFPKKEQRAGAEFPPPPPIVALDYMPSFSNNNYKYIKVVPMFRQFGNFL